jgi:pyruvate-formate lyase-activating enzyme
LARATEEPATVSRQVYLSSSEITAWNPSGPEPVAGGALRQALQRNGLWSPLQIAGRHWQVGCVALEITQRCNLDCELCYLSEHSEAVRDLPLQEIFRRIDLIERLYGAGTNVQVTGGDPTLRRRDEVVAIVRRLADRGLRPALFTNGIKATRTLLRQLTAAGLKDVAFHVDTTQGRKGFPSEVSLNSLRLEYLERTRGLGLHVLFNTTVTDDNLHEIPALARFFIDHADVVHLASFQVQADTGRGVKGGAPPWLNARAVSRLINLGAGVDLGFDFPHVGHPDCNRYTGCVVAGGAVAPLFDDRALVTALLARTEGIKFDRHDRRALLRSCLRIALHNPGLWPSAITFAARKLWELRRGLLASRGRLHKLSFHIHSFMDADRLERARCESCVFMAMTGNGPISMCVHNAKRDAFILQPVTVRSGHGIEPWYPLGMATVPDPARHPLKRLKGRTRRQILARRQQVRGT